MGCGAFIILISTAPNLWILIGVSVHAELSHYLALAMNVNDEGRRKEQGEESSHIMMF